MKNLVVGILLISPTLALAHPDHEPGIHFIHHWPEAVMILATLGIVLISWTLGRYRAAND